MTVTFGFYNSVSSDRLYNAVQMSQIFDGIINDGVYMSQGDKLMVVENTGMQVAVGSGRAWFNHTWTYNDGDIILSIATADALLNRIDAVVLEVNEDIGTRANDILVLTGTPASNPSAPSMGNTATLHRYPLAYVYVGAGVTSIVQSNITNKVGTTDCPFVTGIIDTINASDLLTQWWSDFDTWFQAMKDQLTTDAAGNLQAEIDAIVGDLNPPLTTLLALNSHDHSTTPGAQIPSGGLANNSVTGSKIATGAVSNTKLAADSVTVDKIAANAVGASEIIAGAVGKSEINSAIAGSGLSGGSGAALAVRVDNSTIEIASDILRLKDSGITPDKIAPRGREIYVPVSALHNFSATEMIEGGWGYCLAFDKDVANSIYCGLALPVDAQFGDISLDIIWTVPSGSGNVVWKVYYKMIDDGADIGGSMSTFSQTVAAPTYNHAKRSYIGQWSVNTFLAFELDRDAPNAADTHTGYAELLGLVFGYVADS